MNKIKHKIKTKLGDKKTAKLKKGLGIIRVIKNIICWTMVVVLVVLVITFLLERVNGGTPSVFGYKIYRVETPSMEPVLKVGDVILSHDVSDAKDIKKGDIITFQGDARFGNNRVTHRVFTAPYTNDAGELVLVTKGDANEVTDGEVKFRDVQTKMQNKLEFLTNLYAFFFSPWGLIIFIALLILIFFDEVVNIAKITTGNYKDGDEENIGEIIERIQREDAEKLAKTRLERKKLEDYGEDNFELTSELEDLADSDPEEREEEDDV